MATKLKNLIITKVALVDEGSCSDAHIKLFKRKPEGGSKMTYDDVIKGLDPEAQKIVTDEINKAKAEMPEGAMSAEDAKKLAEEKAMAESEVAKLKEATVVKGQSEEELLKSANLDPAVKVLVESMIAKNKVNEATLAKMRDQQETDEIINKTKELSHIPENTKVVELCKSIKGIPGAVDQLVGILKSAEVLIAKGEVFKEAGATGNVGNSDNADAAWKAIEKAADEMVVKGRAVSRETASSIVMKEKPEMYEEYVKLVRAE